MIEPRFLEAVWLANPADPFELFLTVLKDLVLPVAAILASIIVAVLVVRAERRAAEKTRVNRSIVRLEAASAEVMRTVSVDPKAFDFPAFSRACVDFLSSSTALRLQLPEKRRGIATYFMHVQNASITATTAITPQWLAGVRGFHAWLMGTIADWGVGRIPDRTFLDIVREEGWDNEEVPDPRSWRDQLA